jgi:hypothetical protein
VWQAVVVALNHTVAEETVTRLRSFIQLKFSD